MDLTEELRLHQADWMPEGLATLFDVVVFVGIRLRSSKVQLSDCLHFS